VDESVGDKNHELGFQCGSSDAVTFECFRLGKETAVGLRDLCWGRRGNVNRVVTGMF
jgi:hypothetical protein